MAAGLLLGAAGCASLTSARHSRADVRDSATLSEASPRLLLAGPGRLLHVDMERRTVATIYRVPQRAGTNADCAGEPPRAEAIIDMTGVALDVPRDESVCVLLARRASLSWHARHVPASSEPRPDAPRHASLLP